MKKGILLLAVIVAALVFVAPATASPPPPLRTAHPAKGNLAQLRNELLRFRAHLYPIRKAW